MKRKSFFSGRIFLGKRGGGVGSPRRANLFIKGGGGSGDGALLKTQ